MTISYGAAGASASAAESVTPALPAGASAGMLAVLQVVSGHQDDPTPATPSGWLLAGSFSGGGGSFGAGTGPRRITFFVRELLASNSAPTVAIPTGGTGSTIAARIYTLSRSAGTGWRWAAAFAEDTSSGTGFSAASAIALTWKAGDFAVIGYGIPLSTATFSAEGVAASGITFGTVTEQADDSITAGNDSRFVTATGAVSSGAGTQAPTMTATLSAASTGVAGVLRVREASSTLTVSAQSVFPPRNLVAATSLAADDIVTATLYRQVGTTLTPVRAASGVDVTGADDLLRIDAEQPFGVSLNYAADLVDVNGNVWRITSGSITSSVDSDVLSDAVRGIGAAVIIQTWPDKKRDRDATVFNVGGRMVAVSRPRSSAQATVTVRTMTDEEGDALQEALDGATEGVLLIRKQVSLPGVDNYLAVLADSENRTWYNPIRYWALDTIETEAWADVLEAAGFTLQDIADNYTSLQDLADDFTPGTLLDIALFDFGTV